MWKSSLKMKNFHANLQPSFNVSNLFFALNRTLFSMVLVMACKCVCVYVCSVLLLPSKYGRWQWMIWLIKFACIKHIASDFIYLFINLWTQLDYKNVQIKLMHVTCMHFLFFAIAFYIGQNAEYYGSSVFYVYTIYQDRN